MKTYEVLRCDCFGSFAISWEAAEKYGIDILKEKECISLEGCFDETFCKENNKVFIEPYLIPRHDKKLISIFKEMGSEKFSAPGYAVALEEIDTPMYEISNYDGYETISPFYTEGDFYMIEKD